MRREATRRNDAARTVQRAYHGRACRRGVVRDLALLSTAAATATTATSVLALRLSPPLLPFFGGERAASSSSQAAAGAAADAAADAAAAGGGVRGWGEGRACHCGVVVVVVGRTPQ